MQYTEEQLLETYNKLPADIQAAIADAETEKKITIIGQRHNLHVDQIGDLADETGLVMLGLKHPNQFVSSLAQRLNLAPNEAETIAQEINREVLVTIRDTIRKMAENNNGGMSRDQVLNEIENPSKAPATSEIFEQKVSKIFNLSSEKADVTPAAPQAAAPATAVSPEKPLKPWEQDPYLEKP